MIKNILQLLEKTSEKYPDKLAFSDSKNEITYDEFVKESKKIGTHISEKLEEVQTAENEKNCIPVVNQPIVIFIDKTINCLKAMMGILYSGNFYTIIDIHSPKERAQSILDTLNPKLIVTDNKNISKLRGLELKKENSDNSIDEKILILEDCEESLINQKKLDNIRDRQIDTDPMYILFTSGSTGIPKGTVVNHRSVITYINWVKDTFEINENTIWGSQTPFYFSMSITDVFTTILTGATLYIIPKMYFSFPIKLIEYMNEKKINSIYWVPSALCIVANLGALKAINNENSNNCIMPNLEKILFAGEVMPTKQLNIWRKALPNCIYANLYGPTETTDICSYYKVDRDFKDDESIPIGKHCDNCNLIIVKEDGTEAKQEVDENGKPIEDSEKGELLVRGSFLASGYYGNDEKTKSAFIQNPLNNKYPELVYKTGDIVKYNKNGELIYLSRKDYQIKHMGYRIELGEIERNIYGIEKIVLCTCIYDENEQKIVLFYQGEIPENDLAIETEKKLLPYMRPNKYIKLKNMPYNSNGKIDRKKLKQDYENNKQI